MSGIRTRVMRPLTFAQIRRVSPVRRGGSDRRLAAMYQDMERVFGVISPPIALHSPAPDTMAAAWTLLYETQLVPGIVDRAAKEAIATAISKGNDCPYCVTVHGTMMETLDYGQAAAAIAADSAEKITDPAVRAVSAWARASVRADTAAEHEPPFEPAHAPEAMGIVLQYQYINRMVNVFLGEAPLPKGVPGVMMRFVRPQLAKMLYLGYQNEPAPGGSLDLLPAAPLRPALWWAADDARVAKAVARADAAIEGAGRRSVPAEVRELVLTELAAWDGQPKGVSRAWVNEAVRGLAAEQQPAGRLALLVAFASYQVDDAVVEAFRAGQPTDTALVELTSWASMAAAVRATEWTWISGTGPGRPVALEGGAAEQR